MEEVVEKTVEQRVELLERHARFKEAVDVKVDRSLAEFGSRLRQIYAFASAISAGQLEAAGGARDADGKVARLGEQFRQLDEKLADIDVKLDQVVRLLTPESID